MRAHLLAALIATVAIPGPTRAERAQCSVPLDGSNSADVPAQAPTAPPEPTAGARSDAVAAVPSLEGVPALRHVLQSGASLRELGQSHGLRSVLARHGDGFMVLQVAPDGAAVVAGLQSAITPAQLRDLLGPQMKDLGVAHGLDTLFLRNGGEFQVLYATPDGQAVIPGVMWDADGTNLTRKQVEPIAGTIPTVVVGQGAEPPASASVAPTSSGLVASVEKADFGLYGDPNAPRLWMFIDPQCAFSIRAMRELQPLVDAKRVQLAVIPVAVIDYEDNGQSTRSALAMLSKPASQMVEAWRARQLDGPAASDAGANLTRNMAAGQAVGLKGTPTFVWRKADGSEARSDGLPADLSELIATIGGQS